jgi:hypothetical protein
MSKGPTCHTCSSPQVEAVDAAIAAHHLSLRRIADLFGLKVDSVRRHKINGHVLGLDTGRMTSAVAPSVGSDDSTATMRREAMSILRAIDPDRVGPGVLIARMNAIRLMVADIDRAEPPDVSVGALEERPDFQELIGKWFIALEKFPEAREAMLAALRPSGGA